MCCFPATDDMRWVKIPATGDIPGGRASHSSAVFQDHLYIFGGIGPDGTLDTTYKYHTGREAAFRGAMVEARQLGNTLPAQVLGLPLELHHCRTECSELL